MTAIALDILLHGQRIGRLSRLDSDRSIFNFDESYLADERRPTLSLGYKDTYGQIIDEPRAYQTKIEPFFSNLLPEGTLREFLARQAGVKPVREFPLLAQLGRDLPGAVSAVPVEGGAPIEGGDEDPLAPIMANALRFSLAGVQLKFSALKNNRKGGGLTIPASGMGGDWIVKLPSARHADVPENEFACMALAGRLGIEVPDIDLLPISGIDGLPDGLEQLGHSAFAIRRFDRSGKGPIQIEDFAQVFGVYPEEKYENATYRSLLNVLAIETDEPSIIQFVKRLTFSVLIGNGDMHLKNWSLIYPDGRRPILAPAYDLLSTIPYIPEDRSALKFLRSNAWGSFTYDELTAMADKARLPAALIVNAAKETVQQFDDLWSAARAELPFPDAVAQAIEKHRGTLEV